MRFRLRRLLAEQLPRQLTCGDNALAVGMEKRRVETGARCGPPVLEIVGTRRSCGRSGRDEVAHERDDEPGALESRRLVGHANLERPQAGMRARVPPDARVV